MSNPLRTVLLAGALATAHAGMASADAAEPELSAEQRIEIVATWYQSRDYNMLADDLDWQHAPGFFGGETLTRPSDVEIQLVSFYAEVFDNIAVEIDRIEAGQESVFSIGTYILTPRNNDETVRAPFIHVWTINEDGELSGLVQYADTLLISQALVGARVLVGR